MQDISEEFHRQLITIRSELVEMIDSKSSISDVRLELGHKADKRDMLGTLHV